MPDGSPPWPTLRDTPRLDGLPPLPKAEWEVADRGLRFAAATLDGCLASAPLVLIATCGGATPFQAVLDAEDTTLRSLLVLMAAGVVPAVYATQWFLVTTTGQSIGKRLLGLRIVRTDGRLPGFFHGVVLRDWVVAAAALVFPIAFLIDDFLVLFAPRRAIHDYIAGTMVVPATFAFVPKREPGPAGPVVESGPWTAPARE